MNYLSDFKNQSSSILSIITSSAGFSFKVDLNNMNLASIYSIYILKKNLILYDL